LKKTVLWLLVAVALVFFAGFGAGTIAVSRAKAGARGTYLQDLENRYDLAPDQVQRVKSLLEAEGEAIDRILDSVESTVKSQVAEARLATQERIRAVLTDRQRSEFDRDLAATRGGG
jgi:hypothetical protein